MSPVGVSCDPRDAVVKEAKFVILSSASTTDNYCVRGQDGLAVESPLLRKGWDGTGVEGNLVARGEGQFSVVKTHLPLP